MASNTIKGLTIEIGGDTTKLGKALEKVEKQTRSLSSELGQINKLLKLDPGNIDLLAQKQKVLAEAVTNTKEKLDALKKAEKQVQEQFERGEVSAEQVRSLQREIIATSKKLESYEKAAEETAEALDKLGKDAEDVKDGTKKTEKGADDAAEALDDMADSADKAGDASDGLGSKLGGLAKGGLKALAAGVTAAVGALVASAEASREYRTEMGKLDTAFTTAGHSSQAATQTYKSLQGVLGETDQAVEAANHLAKLTDNEQDLETWTHTLTGVYATFGASLPIEGLTEAANETAKVGQVTGPLADALNWAGVSEDEFNASLAACSTEQERQTLIMNTLNGLYGDAADKYKETNAEVIRANQANEEWNSTMAEVGASVEPILTDVKLLGASLLADLLPGITEVTESFRGMLNGDEGAAADMGAALSGIFEQLMSGISSAIPKVVKSLGDMLPDLVEALQEGLPLVLQGVLDAVSSLVTMLTEQLPVILPLVLDTIMSLVNMLVQQLPVILPQILNLITSLVSFIVQQLPTLIPQIVSLVVSVIELLGEQLPLLIPQLAEALITIITLLTEQLPVIIPMLIDACITIVMALIQALPDILTALTDALPGILSAVWDAIVMIFVNLPEWFGQIFEGAVELIYGAFGALGEWFGDIWADVTNVFAPVGEWFSGIFSDAWAGIEDAFSSVSTFFSDIWSNIKEAFGSVSTWFKDVFSEAWEAVKNVFTTTGEVFLNIGTGILDALKIVVNAIISGLNTVIKLPFEGLNGILDTLQALSFLNISPFSWLTWRAPVPQIPELATGGVLKRGQVGLLEGDGAEAVVPLEKNTEWIQRVAQEFVEQVKSVAGANIMDSRTAVAGTVTTPGESGMMDRLDKILVAIERGQILTIDGKTWVGATADMTDSALGERRALVARGAV